MKKAIDAAPYIDRKANCRNADPDTCIELYKKIIVDHFQDKLTGENKLLTSSEPILEAFTATIVKIPFTKIIFRIYILS